MKAYTIVGYDPQTDEETKVDTTRHNLAFNKAYSMYLKGLIDIQVFADDDEFENTKTFELRKDKLGLVRTS